MIKAAVEGDPQTLSNLEALRDVATEMKELCLKGNWQDLPSLFNREYEARVQLSEAFVSEEILRLKELSLAHGGQAVKICGAGGGGCVMLWSEPEQKQALMEACQKSGFQTIAAQPVVAPA